MPCCSSVLRKLYFLFSPFIKMLKRKRENELEHLDPFDETLEEVNAHVKQVYDILRGEMSRVRQEKEALDAVSGKLKHVHFCKTLKLNVGGQVFLTSLETMQKDPGSMFRAMFSRLFDTEPRKGRTYFIDRDGTHFRYILNYLRTGQLLIPESELVRKELLAEAEFYQIQGIIGELRARPFKESLILSGNQRQTLIEWLKHTLANASSDYVLLYRATRNGWASANFHACCDYKGPTVTVVKYGNYIFGGYTEQEWESPSTGMFKKDSTALLFSLVNPAGLGPTVLPLKPGQEGHAIQCYCGYGPSFGGGSDLCIGNVPNSNNCSVSSLNNTYECPTGQNAATFLTGKQKFTICEMEVFGYQK